MWKVDETIGRVTAVTGLPYHASDIAVDENAVWTANDDGTLSRIDPEVGTLLETIPLGKYPRLAYPVQVAAGGGSVWVAMH